MPQSRRTPGVGATCNLLDGGAVGVIVNGANAQNVLMSPFELMAATDTVYSALGIKPCRITLVLDENTVVSSIGYKWHVQRICSHALTVKLGYSTCATKMLKEDNCCRNGIIMIYIGCNMTSALPGGGAIGSTVNWTNAENELISPLELMAATDTVYSSPHAKPRSVTLVLGEYTVKMPPMPLLSWYLTL